MRAEFLVGIEASDTLEKGIGVIGHIASARHPVRQVERAILVAEMLVVVPKARHQKLAGGVNHARAVR